MRFEPVRFLTSWIRRASPYHSATEHLRSGLGLVKRDNSGKKTENVSSYIKAQFSHDHGISRDSPDTEIFRLPG